MSKPDMMLWLSDARGVFIPRDFARSFVDRAKSVTGVIEEQWQVLEAGPDQELYWDVWDEVIGGAIITDENGVKYTIWQNGDCWLVPVGMEYNEEEDTFKWPEEDDATQLERLAYGRPEGE
jgi:hypothetical protein